ncbi:Hypothetical predicted protein, partial [Pelobates cultripes]
MEQQQIMLLRNLFPFQITTTSLTYLGIKLSLRLTDLYDLNYKPLLATAHSDLQRWEVLG